MAITYKTIEPKTKEPKPKKEKVIKEKAPSLTYYFVCFNNNTPYCHYGKLTTSKKFEEEIEKYISKKNDLSEKWNEKQCITKEPLQKLMPDDINLFSSEVNYKLINEETYKTVCFIKHYNQIFIKLFDISEIMKNEEYGIDMGNLRNKIEEHLDFIRGKIQYAENLQCNI